MVGYNEKFNNSIERHALDLKDEAIFRNPNPINVTFYDMKKFDQVNPVIGKLAAQVEASKLTEQEINQKLLDNFEADTIEAKLDKLKYGSPDDDDDDDDNKKGPGGMPGGTPVPPKTPLDDVDELQKRLDRLRGNNVSPHNIPEKNAKIIQRKNSEKVINQQLRQRQKELSNLPKGNVGKKRSSIRSSLKFRLPETPPATPFDDYWDDVADQWIKSTSVSGPPEPPLFDYERDFRPLSRSAQKAHLPPITPKTTLPPPPSNTPRETSFLTPEGSVSSLHNKLPFIAPIPSKPNINNFSRPITDITDQKNNTISITPKKIPLPPIGQKQLSKQLHKIFRDVDDTIQERADTFKERNSDIDDLVEKVGRTEGSKSTFEFEFFSGGENFKFNSFVKAFGLTTKNFAFVDFLQSDFCKDILLTNALKIHIETGNIYYNDIDTNESIFEFITNQQNTSKGVINNEFKFDGNYKQYFD